MPAGYFTSITLSLGCSAKYYQNDVNIANINLKYYLLGVSYSRDTINKGTIMISQIYIQLNLNLS